MVDALRRVHASLRRGGVLIDVRPALEPAPRVELRGRVVARLAPLDMTRHSTADAAVRSLVAEEKLRPTRSGRFWYRHTFPDRKALIDWVEGRDDWTVDRRLIPRGRPTLRRAVHFAHYRTS